MKPVSTPQTILQEHIELITDDLSNAVSIEFLITRQTIPLSLPSDKIRELEMKGLAYTALRLPLFQLSHGMAP